MSAEDQTFADVLNGFSLNSRRSARRPEQAEPAPSPPPEQRPPEFSQPGSPPQPAPPQPGAWQQQPYQSEENASIVRAYAWTGGRTRSDYRLEIETLVSTSARAIDLLATLSTEHQDVAQLCRQSKSVAEVGALLRVPLGVVRVLLGDMARLGLITVHDTETAGQAPGMDLLERVLRGLTNLRT
jgi:hypothetical protein